MQMSIFNQEIQEEMARSFIELVEATAERIQVPRGSLQPKNAAIYIDVSVDTLTRWEALGLNYSKINGIKLYDIKDLDDFKNKYKFKN